MGKSVEELQRELDAQETEKKAKEIEIATLKRESAEHRTRANDLQVQLDKLSKIGDKGDEKINAALAERDAAVAQLRQSRIDVAVLGKAQELGFQHPADVLKLADLSKVVIDENNQVTGFELDTLAKSGRLPMKQTVIGTMSNRVAGTVPPEKHKIRPKVRI